MLDAVQGLAGTVAASIKGEMVLTLHLIRHIMPRNAGLFRLGVCGLRLRNE